MADEYLDDRYLTSDVQNILGLRNGLMRGEKGRQMLADMGVELEKTSTSEKDIQAAFLQPLSRELRNATPLKRWRFRLQVAGFLLDRKIMSARVLIETELELRRKEDAEMARRKGLKKAAKAANAGDNDQGGQAGAGRRVKDSERAGRNVGGGTGQGEAPARDEKSAVKAEQSAVVVTKKAGSGARSTYREAKRARKRQRAHEQQAPGSPTKRIKTESDTVDDNNLTTRDSSPMTPLPDDIKPVSSATTAVARAKWKFDNRSRKLGATPTGIPAKTFTAVMRLVLGLGPSRPATRAAFTPLGKPPVWAMSRQELCEALPYYRSFQSSLYMKDRVGYAYLLDGYPSPRDAWAHNGRVIISHGGGQCTRSLDHLGRPVVTLRSDQTPSDARVDTLLQSERNQTPIILIAGDGYAKLPWRMREAYVVLGWYRVTHTWVEAERANVDKGYCLRYKIRFDWVASQGDPWWEGTTSGLPGSETLAHPDDQRKTGVSRRLPGDRLLTTGQPPKWASVVSDGVECPSCRVKSRRVYAEGWVCLQPACKQFWLLTKDAALWPITPGMLSYDRAYLAPIRLTSERIPFSVVPDMPQGEGRALWRGWVCPCGRANCRYRWEVWACKACGKEVSPMIDSPVAPTPPAALMHASIDASMPVSMRRIKGGWATVYKLLAGTVYHISHVDTSWADAIFQTYQRDALKGPLFERRPLKGGTVKGELLAQHFAVNSGATYKYNVESMSLTFEQSPPSVLLALDAIKQRVSKVVGAVEFNEILSVFYREGQKMSWHDDGEAGLGEYVASLSLGAHATMSWRRKHGPTVLSITLSHGDIVIMQGRQMQMLYDHRVVPLGFRVAATAREIGSGH